MKKIITLALALVMLVGCVFSFASCSNDELYFGKSYAAQSAQIDVLTQLNAGNVDVGVMDSIMANYYMSKDTTYADNLMIADFAVTDTTEQYGIAGRKGSGLIKGINWALVELAKDGTIDTIADKYGVKSELCIDKNATVSTDLTDAEEADVNYVYEKGKIIVGYTLFAPIAYKDGDNLIGFDVELAKAVAAKMGIDVEFQLIEWNSKEALLESKSIDLIWNGMTINEERKAAMEISMPYLNNKQVAVIRKADKDKYVSLDSCAKAIVAAESGSAGESCIVKPVEE